MFKTKYLRNMLILSFAMATFLPLFNIFYLHPEIIDVITKDVETTAIRTANHLKSMLLDHQQQQNDVLSRINTHIMETMKRDFGLTKIKLFSPSGEVTYSTDLVDIGQINQHEYFHEIVSKGIAHTQLVEKHVPSLEGQLMTADVVETYAPIVHDETFMGAFEIYYDITATKKEYERLIFHSSILLAGLSFGFVTLILLTSLKAHRSITERMKFQQELKKHQEYLEDMVKERTENLTSANSKLQQEIHERSRIEQSLKEASEEWRTTFDATNDMVLMLDRGWKIIRVNRAVTQFFERPFGDLLQKNYLDLMAEADPSSDLSALEKMQNTSKHKEQEVYLQEKGIWLLVSVDQISDGAGNPSGAVVIQRNITEIKKLQESIIQAKDEWENSFNTINDAITIHDNDFNIIRANKAAEKLLNLPLTKILEQKCYESYHRMGLPFEGCASCETYKTGKPAVAELFVPHLEKFLEIKALARLDKEQRIIGVVHVVRDVTARKKAEEEQEKLQSQLLQIQKMESIGRLAGGIAHDFNNLLSIIMGYSELSLSGLSDNDPIRENIKNVYDSGEKAAQLTRQLLAFSRKQILEMKNLDLAGTVVNMGKFLSRMIGEDVNLEVKNSGKMPNIKADPVQIEQIIMNLVVNARDAMPNGGQLSMEIAEVELEEDLSRGHEELEPGAYVTLTVTDTGVGMTDEVRERVFEPFFTTKKIGKGTGLGLATVYGIVKQHNGHIFAFSEPGEGTTFKVYFPALEEEQFSEQLNGKVTRAPGGEETLLVVDDDPMVRKLVVDTLRPLGYGLLEASGGEDALGVSRKLSREIDLLLTDVIMTGMNGRELAEKLKENRPDTRILYMSGYTDEIIAHYGVLDEGIAFIQKPLTPTSLAQKVRGVLDDQPRGASE
jgi:PAS domain S-box-containing protein